MIYLFLQTWIWILLAIFLGVFIGWLIWHKLASLSNNETTAILRKELNSCRKRFDTLKSKVTSVAQDLRDTERDTPAVTFVHNTINEAWRPHGLPAPEDSADDLTRINGIGPIIEKSLNKIGIYHYRQITAFTAENIKWIDDYIGFPGKIEQERWLTQSHQLVLGEGNNI